MKPYLILDGVGFDVKAMAEMTETDFVETHKDTEAITYGKTPEQTEAWLKDAYSKIVAENSPPHPAAEKAKPTIKAAKEAAKLEETK